MSANDLVIQHGEKAAVAVVAIICIWLIYSTLEDPNIHVSLEPSQGIDPRNIEKEIHDIQVARSSAKPPDLKQPLDYAGEMGKRLGRTVPAREVMVGLTNHYDRGPLGGGKVPYLYIYELASPEIVVEDAKGTLKITVTPPAELKSGEGRVRDSHDLTKEPWHREMEAKAKSGVDNYAEQLGCFIEMRKGAGKPFQPLETKTIKKGWVKLEDMTAKNQIIVESDEWESYGFRAYMVAKATGYPFDADEAGPEQAVLVTPERLAEVPEDSAPFWPELGKKIVEKDPDTLKKFCKPQNLKIPGVTLENNKEQFYKSAESSEYKIDQASSPTRFILTSVNYKDSDPANGVETVTILLNKYFTDPKNGTGAWLKEPKTFKVPLHGMLGDKGPGENPATLKTGPLDLTTPFELEDVIQDVDRIPFYLIFPQARANGKQGEKELALNPKEAKKTDVAKFRNKKTNAVLYLVKVDRISPPPLQKKVIYPPYTGFVDEKKEFTKNADTFIQPDIGKELKDIETSKKLEPTPPTAFQPGDGGPLDQMVQKGIFQENPTDTKYYQLPNGTVIYLDQYSKPKYELKKLDKSGQEVAPATNSGEESGGDTGEESPPEPAPEKKPTNGTSKETKPSAKTGEKTSEKSGEKEEPAPTPIPPKPPAKPTK